MTHPKETEMDSNENIRSNAQEELTVLGAVSTETHGVSGTGEENGQAIGAGIEES